MTLLIWLFRYAPYFLLVSGIQSKDLFNLSNFKLNIVS
jgi:hypothetical protein